MKFFADAEYKWSDRDISKPELYYFSDEKEILVASRVNLDMTFNAQKINTITDTGIRKILLKHLEQNQNNPELAFSPEGIEEMNQNLTALNNGKSHQPILKVRTFEPMGNKFSVGQSGNKKDKYVEAAKGTNLFFAAYQDQNGKRSYETIPLNIVIERQKQGLSPCPETNEKGNSLVCHLSPNDLIYLPVLNEIENPKIVDFKHLTKEQLGRVYKVISFTGNRLYGIPSNVATSIVDKFEYTLLNKLEFSLERISIKDRCWKLKIDRLGNISI